MVENSYLVTLQQLIFEYFDKEELRLLCFSLNCDFDEIKGERKSSKVQDLLVTLNNQERIPDLLVVLQKKRPNVNWPPIPKPKSHVTESSENSISFTVARQRIKSWIGKRPWISNEIIAKSDLTQTLNLHRWPLIVYIGKCAVEYSIRRHKYYGTFDKKMTSYNNPEDWKRINCWSGDITINLVRIGKLDHLEPRHQAILSCTVDAINGKSNKMDSDKILLNIVSKLPIRINQFMYSIPQRARDFLVIDSRQSSNPIWPKLDQAKNFINQISLHLDTNQHYQPSTFEDMRNEVEDTLISTVQNTNYAEWTTAKFWNTQLYTAVFPFWVLDTKHDQNRYTIVLNGINGDVLYSHI